MGYLVGEKVGFIKWRVAYYFYVCEVNSCVFFFNPFLLIRQYMNMRMSNYD